MYSFYSITNWWLQPSISQQWIRLQAWFFTVRWKKLDHKRRVHDKCTVHTAVSERVCFGIKWHGVDCKSMIQPTLALSCFFPTISIAIGCIAEKFLTLLFIMLCNEWSIATNDKYCSMPKGTSWAQNSV